MTATCPRGGLAGQCRVPLDRSARLTIRPAPEIGDGVRYFEIDCDHGTTTAFTDGSPVFPDSAIVDYLLVEHDAEEHCGCTAELHARYGAKAAHRSPVKPGFTSVRGKG